MAKAALSAEVRETFSRRLNEALDKRGFPKKGRASRLGEMYGVTTTAVSAWLHGSVPGMDTVLQMAKDFDVTVSWLTGSPGEIHMLDTGNLRKSVSVVAETLAMHGLWNVSVSPDKLATLFAMVYRRLMAGESLRPEELEDHVSLLS